MHEIDYNGSLNPLKGRVRGRVVIAGIGNELRGDDAFGPYLAEGLKGRISARVLNCGTAFENYYNTIVKEAPDVIILLDTAAFGGPLGGIAVLEKDDILKIGFSTHNISPRVFMELLEGSVKADVLMIGVRPVTTAFGAEMSDEVRAAAETLTDYFMRLLPGGRG